MKKLLVFDGNSIINRAFYAVRPLTNRSGLNTNALFGFLNILKKHLDHQKPDYCAVAFDVHAKTFRHEMYDGYKATRKGMPEELFEQMPYAHRLVEALGLHVLEHAGYEADDILGAAAHFADESDDLCAVLVTGDRDSLQLVSPSVTVLLCTTGQDLVMTPEAIGEKYGLTPKQLIDVKSLMGDSSDNIPGVRGIGEKGALSLIQKAGSLENLYEHLDEFATSPALKQKLLDGQESALLSYRLAKILDTVPFFTAPEEVALGFADKQTLTELFIELEFTRLASTFGLDTTETKTSEKAAENGGQMTLDFSGLAQETATKAVLEEAPISSLRTDTPCIALIHDEHVYVRQNDTYLKVREEDFSRFAKTVSPTVFDAKEFYHFLFTRGANPDTTTVKDDLKLMAYLLDPTGASQSIARAASTFLSKLLSPSADAKTRLDTLFQLEHVLSKLIVTDGMEELYREIELPLSKILCCMEREGILLDRGALLAYGETLKARIAEREQLIYEAAGGELNLNSPKQLGVLLFETLGLPHKKKTKTGYSTDAETLEALRPLSPIVEDILEYRKLQKLYGTYVEGLAKQTETDLRVHTTFLQTQTVTGRLSSADPNLQNIPVRTREGRELRRFFIAPEGCVLLDADYSQVELRILAHLSADPDFLGAFKRSEDIHQKTASEIFHVPLEKVTPEMRKDAKAINFGIVYGIGEYSLSQDLGVSRAKAAEYIRHYFETYPGVKAYLEQTVEAARASGEVTTLYGRRRRIPELSATKKNLVSFGERVAMNTPIQGTAADIMKLAMVRVAKRLKEEGRKSKILLQVHDELILECPEAEVGAVKKLLKEEMEHAASLSLTLVAEVGEGQNWLDAK